MMKTKWEEIMDRKPLQETGESFRDYCKSNKYKAWWIERDIFFQEVKKFKLEAGITSKAGLFIHDHKYNKKFITKLFSDKHLTEYARKMYGKWGKKSEEDLLRWLGLMPPEGMRYICPHCAYSAKTTKPFQPHIA